MPGSARAKSATIRIERPIDPASFQRVVVRFQSRGSCFLTLQLESRSSSVAHDEPQPIEAQESAQSLILDLPDNAQRADPFEALTLSIEGAFRSFWVESIDFVDRPLEHWLPDPNEGARLFDCASEARRSVGLLFTAPLETTFDVPPAGRFAFSYARPPGTPDPGLEARLSCALSAGEAALEHTFELAAGTGWHDAAIDLGDWSGRTATARFTIDAPVPCLVAEPMIETPVQDAPTVVLVTSDTHRADHLGLAANDFDLETPTLDALAADGVWFARAQSATNITLPSHAALFTGRSPRDTRVLDNRDRLADSAATLAEVFEAAGWTTQAIVSMRHLGHDHSGLGQGFGRFFTPLAREQRADAAVGLALDWLAAARGRPVFLWLHVNDAHAPYAPPEPWDRRYWRKSHDPYDPALPEPEGPPPPEDWRLRDYDWARAQYRGEVGFLDAALEPLFEAKRVRRGIVAFTADHGESLGDVPIGWGHEGVYPASLRVPLILRWPGAPAGQRVDAPTDQLALGRTLLELCELDAARTIPGRSLADLESGRAPTGTPLFALSNGGLEASITWGSEHLILGLAGDPRRRPTRNRPIVRHRSWLYDVERDPDCAVDLAPQRPERVRVLRERLIDWLASAEALELRTRAHVDARTLRELAELGYAEDSVADGASEAWFEPDDCEYCRRWR